MLGKILEELRAASPLVHCITNYVTVNDCANILLAAGASPVMADDPDEVEEITAISSALVINIGTLNRSTIPSMLLSGKEANDLSKPVLLDPVGAGASTLRTETAKRLIRDVRFTAIRGNISEIKALAIGAGTTRGVDADDADAVTSATLDSVVAFAKSLSKETGAVIAITGKTDIVADASSAYLIHNGHPMMARITGSGCMLSALTGAYLAAHPERPLDAVAASLCAMGLCGEIAYKRLEATGGGNATYRTALIDAVYGLTGAMLDAGARYDVR
ncbi:hydroxyethylthiazole kinase [Oscillospiraceae bacterium CM]|nr:hydroxyethylthiazole kinase [Oscillospiraceae bacterium CM]